MEEDTILFAKNLVNFLDKDRRRLLESLLLEYSLSENSMDRLNSLSDIRDFILSTGLVPVFNLPVSKYLDGEECSGDYFLGKIVWMGSEGRDFYLRD